MLILLLVSLVVAFAFIGYYISKIDEFTSNIGFEIDDSNDDFAAVVLGDSQLVMGTIYLLEDSCISVRQVIQPHSFDCKGGCKLLLALSESDVDNLIFYKMATQLNNIEYAICLCNNTDNEQFFVNENIPFIPAHFISPEKILENISETGVLDCTNT